MNFSFLLLYTAFFFFGLVSPGGQTVTFVSVTVMNMEWNRELIVFTCGVYDHMWKIRHFELMPLDLVFGDASFK